MASEELQLRLLGPPQVIEAGSPVTHKLASKAQAILYYLAVTGQPQSRAALATLLWGDVPDDLARTNLRKALANLRQVLGDFFDLDGQTVGFKIAPWVDVIEFQVSCTMCQVSSIKYQVDFLPDTRHLARDTPVPDTPHLTRDTPTLDTSHLIPDTPAPDTPTLDTLRQAVDLYRGDFLSGYYVRHAPDFETWMLAEQARLREMVIQTLHTLAEHLARQGELPDAIAVIRRLLSLEPWREEAHRQLMRLLAQNGQRSAALAQFEICRQALADELGVEPGPETRALYQQLRAGNLDPVTRWQGDKVTTNLPVTLSPPHRVTPAHNLPPQPTPFIGREQEMAGLIERLTDPACRLLTLTGPGGIGKTRLAIQTAQVMLESEATGDLFEHGVLFVPLAGVSAASGIAPAIAAAANFNFSGSIPPKQQLLGYLQGQRRLLILDNLEHLLSLPTPPTAEHDRAAEDTEAAGFITEILATAPAVKILVTSREALNLQEAWFHPIEGLSFPPLPNALVGEELGTKLEVYDAVRLFVQSAQRARVQFSLAAEQAYVVRICQLVEGIPLALELAAAWLTIIPTEKIVQEIERSLDFLSSRYQNLPARHRSMRAVFEHSWELLPPAEKDILKHLSVFRGSFEHEAAQQVAGASFMSLAILVEKSLVRVTETGRYHMHELLRQFAAEKLAESPQEQAQFRDRHCAYYAGWLDRQDAWLRTERQLQAVHQISADIQNVQTAWRWAVERQQISLLRQFFWSLWFVYEAKSWFHAGAELFGQAAARLSQLEQSTGPEQQQVYAQLLAFHGRFQLRLHRLEQAIPLMAQSVPLLQRFKSERDLGLAYQTLGLIAWVQGRYAEAGDYFEQSVASAESGSDALIAAYARAMSGFVAYGLGEYRLAEQLIRERLPVLRRLGKLWGLVFSLANLSSTLSALEEYAEAEQLLLEGLAISREMGDRWAVADCLKRLGLLLTGLDAAKRLEARQLLLEGIAIYRDIDDHWGLTTTLNQLGQTCAALGEYETARQHLTEAIQLAHQSGLTPIVLDAVVNLAELHLKTRAAAGQAVELLALALNHPASEQPTKDRAARLLAEFEPELPTVAAAKARVQTITLESIVEGILSGV